MKENENQGAAAPRQPTLQEAAEKAIAGLDLALKLFLAEISRLQGELAQLIRASLTSELCSASNEELLTIYLGDSPVAPQSVQRPLVC